MAAVLGEAGGIAWGGAVVVEFCSGECCCCCFWGLLDPEMGTLADVEEAELGGGVCRGLERGLGSWIAFCMN